MKEMEEGVMWLVLCFVTESEEAFIIVISVLNVINIVIFHVKVRFTSQGRGQIRPAILQNPGMDTFRPTEPLSPRKDTLILLWPSYLVKMSYSDKMSSFGKIYLHFQVF